MTDILVRFCSACGTPNGGTKFCAACGASAVVAGAAHETAGFASPAVEYAAARPWTEPSRAVAMIWGSYRPRVAVAYILAAVATVAGVAATSPILILLTSSTDAYLIVMWLPTPAVAAAMLILPGRLALRLIAAGLSALMVAAIAVGLGVVGIAAGVVITLAWFMARQRPGVSYWFLILAAVLTVAVGMVAGFASVPVAVIISVWLGRLVAPAGDRAKARRLAPLDTPVAWAEARTNTLAILALVFGLLGGTGIPIVLGHVSLSQIRRTGESGRGLAIAGLVLGYGGIAIILILGVVALIVTRTS